MKSDAWLDARLDSDNSFFSMFIQSTLAGRTDISVATRNKIDTSFGWRNFLLSLKLVFGVMLTSVTVITDVTELSSSQATLTL